jgi:hypothetical protein
MSKGRSRKTQIVRQEPPKQESPLAERQNPLVIQVVQVVRDAASALVDFADKVAEAIRQRIEGRV